MIKRNTQQQHIVIEIGYLKLKWLAVNQYFLNAGFVNAFDQEDFDEDFDKAVNEVAVFIIVLNARNLQDIRGFTTP